MHRTEYVRRLDPNSDYQYRVSFDSDRGKILGFVVQLEFRVNEDWLPVVRYDTAHGFAHRDRYSPTGISAQHEPMSDANFNKAFTLAVYDVKNNADYWLKPFREHFGHE